MRSYFALFISLWGLVLSQDPNVEVKLNGRTFFGSSSTFAGISIEDQFGFSGRSIRLLYPKDISLSDGCTEFPEAIDGEEFIVMFDRGGCTFNEKLQTAQALGAVSVFVNNQEESVLNVTTRILFNACSVDCEISRARDIDSCESNSNCDSGVCFDAFLSNNVDDFGFCCFLDNLIDMPVQNPADSDAPDVQISAVFFGIESTEFVEAELLAGEDSSTSSDFAEVSIFVKERFRFTVDPSIVILISFGTFSVAVASFIASRDDRKLVSLLWGSKSNVFRVAEPKDDKQLALRGGAKQGEVEEVEAVELSVTQAVAMLVCATLFLVGIFFLVKVYPQQVVIGIIIFFGFGAIYSTSYFFTRPLVRLVLPKSKALYLIPTPKFTRSILEDSYTLESLIGTAITVTLVVIWFVYRHQTEKVWILQNIFSVAVALLFLSSIRLNSLSTGFYFLVGFCIYDIFMVFLTPFFGGESIMLEVATAGGGTQTQTSVEIDEDVNVDFCERTEDEQMPMLFLAPRFDYLGGFGLLGLGDILIPGIIMTYIIRTDYFYAAVKINQLMKDEGHKLNEIGPSSFSLKAFIKAHYFFLSSVFAYLSALVLTFIANLQGWTINGVQGQPALLYIVPIVMTTFLLQLRSEKRKFLWDKSLAELMRTGGEVEEKESKVSREDNKTEEAKPAPTV